VAVGQQRDQHALDHLFLPDHDGVDLGQEIVQKERFPLHLSIELSNVREIHWLSLLCDFHSGWLTETDLQYHIEASGVFNPMEGKLKVRESRKRTRRLPGASE